MNATSFKQCHKVNQEVINLKPNILFAIMTQSSVLICTHKYYFKHLI